MSEKPFAGIDDEIRQAITGIEDEIRQAITEVVNQFEQPRKEVCLALGIPDSLEGQAEWLNERNIDVMHFTSAGRVQELIQHHRHVEIATSRNHGIPPDKRTRPMTKKKAAKLLGRTGDENRAVEWLNACIADGTIRWERRSRQSGVYHFDDFPESVHAKIKPK